MNGPDEIKPTPRKKPYCEFCMAQPKCRCKLKVYLIYKKYVTLCRDCLVKNFM